MAQKLETYSKNIGIEAIIVAFFYVTLDGYLQVGSLFIGKIHLIAIYLILKYIYKLKGQTSIYIAMGLLGLTGIFLMTGNRAKIESVSAAAYIFLVIGVLWQLMELFFEKQHQDLDKL